MKSSRVKLQFKLNETAWTGPSPEIWTKILNDFIFVFSDSFSLSGIESAEQLERKTVFHYNYQYPIRELRQTTEKRSHGVNGVGPLAVFELSEAAKAALRFAPFAHYSFDPDFLREDYLTFYCGPTEIASVDADTSTLYFSDLKNEWYQLLISLNPSIAANLWKPETLLGTTRFFPQI